MMQQIITWFGWGDGIGSLLGISAILTIVVILAPVIAGSLLNILERLQIHLIGLVDEGLARFFVNYVTFPGTFVHEMSHLCLAVITGAEVHEICMFESDDGRLGHISCSNRGPWFIKAIQRTLIGVAPTITGFTLGYFLLQYIFSEPHSIWANIGLWYLVISLIDHSTMSPSDLEGYFKGVWIFVLPLILLFFILGLIA